MKERDPMYVQQSLDLKNGLSQHPFIPYIEPF